MILDAFVLSLGKAGREGISRCCGAAPLWFKWVNFGAPLGRKGAEYTLLAKKTVVKGCVSRGFYERASASAPLVNGSLYHNPRGVYRVEQTKWS